MKRYSPLKLQVDFIVVILLYPALLSEHCTVLQYAIIAWIILGVAWIYQVYFTVIEKLYKQPPVLFNDWFVLKLAGRLFFYDMTKRNTMILAGVVVFGILAFYPVYWMINWSMVVPSGIAGITVVGLIALFLLSALMRFDYRATPRDTLQSVGVSLLVNASKSLAASRSLARISVDRLKQFNIDRNVKLVKPPNIIFIVVESYGRVLIDHPELKDEYGRLMTELDGQLNDSGWHAVSTCSQAPVSGGSSWLSYTTLMYGFRVAAQSVFLKLQNAAGVEEFDSVFNWLRRMGYTSWRLSSLGGYQKMKIPYDKYAHLYGVDQWIRHKDLKFKGKEYGFGPCPPDQFSLNRGAQIVREHGSTPFALFFITQNSHSPYDSPVEVAQDWRSLEDDGESEPQESQFWHRPRFQRYGAAIEYQLRYIIDFVINASSEEDLFVVVGDHQPPNFKDDVGSFETPLHILTKNEQMVAWLKQEGLSSGLSSAVKGQSICHEDFRSLLIDAMVNSYSGDVDTAYRAPVVNLSNA